MDMNIVQKSFTFGNSQISFETGRIARQAHGAVLASMDDTQVLVSVVGAKEAKPGQSFFPLSVDYIEKIYAAGKIPGGFLKREGRPSEKETLTSRLIDRPIRPLFPNGYMNEVQVMIQVISSNKNVDPDILAMIATSAALAISGVPFNGPIGAARVGYQNGNYSPHNHYGFADYPNGQLRSTVLDLGNFMIAFLNGKLLRKSPIAIVIDVQGVGYLVQVSLPTFYGLPEIGAPVSMRIHTVVREDEIRLFGFSSELEQVVFEKLIAISKVGPKLAISILSGMSVEDFLTAISNKDIAKLNGIPGVGAKTAERLALELHDKLKDIAPEVEAEQAPIGDAAFDDALSALLNLGYKKVILLSCPNHTKKIKNVSSCEDYTENVKNILEKNGLKVIVECKSIIEDLSTIFYSPHVYSVTSSFSFFPGFSGNSIFKMTYSNDYNYFLDYNLIPWHIDSSYLSHYNVRNYHNTEKVILKLKKI